jgi:hypothetical protein
MFKNKNKIRRSTDLSNSKEPMYAPRLTQEELDAELAELRQNPKFIALEKRVVDRLGGPISYRITDEGVGYMVTNERAVYIGRYVHGYSYTSLGKASMSYDEDIMFLNSDVSSDVPGVQLPFSVKRVIVHEMTHHSEGFLGGNETNTIKYTNGIMSDYGEYPRWSHSGHLIDRERF